MSNIEMAQIDLIRVVDVHCLATMGTQAISFSPFDIPM